ncbi:nuclease-related domain-containing protein [Gracilibacillus salitolerans]|uniref:nuclease-related domain-containing protein n=1 Tax=Gracilibacillus salitolerans TaxID=2663022 RepID=UPI00189113D3|nr:nuclease-related domain-containing protein [Gracilibacillus salitolerans]
MLSSIDQKRYQRLKCGYDGELLFDTFVQAQHTSFYVLHDLQLMFNDRFCQIDSVLLANNTMYIFEVKNYAGEYYFDHDALCMGDQVEIENPINQRNGTESLVRSFLQFHGYDIVVKAYIIFINPQCTVFHTPVDKQLLFYSNLKRFLLKLATNSHITQLDTQFSELLQASHNITHSYQQIPNYQCQELQKGVTCQHCGSFSFKITYSQVQCQECQQTEVVQCTILRHIEEFCFLFPFEKLTTKTIYEWCDGRIAVKRSSRITQVFSQEK